MLTHYADLIRLYWKTILAVAFLTGALSCGASIALLGIMPLYKSNITLNMQPSEEALRFNDAFMGVTQLNPANIIAQAHIERLLSRPVAERALDNLTAEGAGGLAADRSDAFDRLKAFLWRNWAMLNYGYFEPVGEREQALEELMKATDIEVVAGSYIMKLEITYDDPQIAARAANALAQAYIEVSAEAFAEEAAVVDAALAALQSERQDELASQLARRRALNRDLGFESVGDGRAILLATRNGARQALAASEREVDTLRDRIEAAGETDAATPAALMAQLREAEALQAQRGDALARAEAGLETLDRTEALLVEVDRKIGEAENDLAELQRRRIATELARKARLDQVDVVNEAVAPSYPAFPMVLLNTVVGTVVGLMLALAPIAVLDVLDDRVRTREDLRLAVGTRALPTTPRTLFGQARRFLRTGRNPGGPLRRHAEAMGRRFLAEGRPRWPDGCIFVTAFGTQKDVARLHAVTEAAVRLLAPNGRHEINSPQVIELPGISHLSDWAPYRDGTVVIGVTAGAADRAEVESAAASAADAGAAPFLTVLI